MTFTGDKIQSVGHGVHASASSSVTLTGSAILTIGAGAAGLRAQDANMLVTGIDFTITTLGENS